MASKEKPSLTLCHGQTRLFINCLHCFESCFGGGGWRVSLLSFVKVLFLIRYSWNFMTFPWIYLGTFWRKIFSKNVTLHWQRHHSWTLVSWNFSGKGVSIFCMLCCSCLRVGVMSYRIIHVTKLIPNHYSQWRHNDVIMASYMVKL